MLPLIFPNLFLIDRAKKGVNNLKFVSTSEYKDAEILYYYARACDSNSNSNLDMAEYYLKHIPADYNSDLATEINSFRDSINSKVEVERQTAEDKKQKEVEKRATHFYVGDSSGKVLRLFGNQREEIEQWLTI